MVLRLLLLLTVSALLALNHPSLLFVVASSSAALSSSPRDWSVADVQRWLTEVVALPSYAEMFEKEAIDGEVLLELTADELQSSLGVDKLGHRKKIEKEISKLKEGGQGKRPTPPTESPPSHPPPSPPAPAASSRPPSTPSRPSSRSSPPPPPPVAGAAQFEAAAAAAQKKKQQKKKGGPPKPKKKSSHAPHPLASPATKRSVHLTETDKSTIRDMMRDALASHQSGDLEHARHLYTTVLEKDPFNARALHMLGLVVMVADSDFPAAASLLERSIELSDEADTHVNLANFYWQQQHKEEAMQHWEYALSLQVIAGGTATRQRYADTAYGAAMEAYNEGDVASCKRLLILAIRLCVEAEMIHYPIDHYPPPYESNAEAMREANLQLTHNIRTTLIDSWLHLGLLYEQDDDYALALACYNRALLIQPDPLDETKAEHTRIATIRTETQNYRSSMLGRTRDMPSSPLSKQKLQKAELEADALSVDRTNPREKKLVEFLHKTCHFAEANRLANLIIDDVIFHSPSYRFLFSNSTQIVEDRDRYSLALSDLLSDPTMASLWSTPLGLEWCRFRFYLAYHGLNNREVNEKLAAVYLYMAPGLEYTAPHLKEGQLVQWNGRKIKVGFISAFLTHHPVGRTLQGYIEHLPRDKFEVIIFFITLQPNIENDWLLLKMQQWADTFVRLPVERTRESRDLINTQKPDVLIYGDIGMEPTSFFLAFSRLAPVQALTFGHPDTSGLKTIDYFLSHINMDEPNHGAEFYTEKLVSLEGIGYWHKAGVPSRFQTREELGLADHQLGLPTPPKPVNQPYAWTMYLVTKSIQFYSPEFMDVVAHILHRHPTSFVALLVDIGKISRGFDVHNQCQETILDGIESRLYALSRNLSTSAVRSSPPVPILQRQELSGRVRFVDKGDHDYFMSLLKMTDVLLQPMPLDGTTTTLEAVTLATPTVLFEGPAIGGRMGQAIYRHMHVTANIAQSDEEYIDIAVRLGQDREFNAWLRKEVETNREKYKVYEDPKAIDVMADWIVQAVKKSGVTK